MFPELFSGRLLLLFLENLLFKSPKLGSTVSWWHGSPDPNQISSMCITCYLIAINFKQGQQKRTQLIQEIGTFNQLPPCSAVLYKKEYKENHFIEIGGTVIVHLHPWSDKKLHVHHAFSITDDKGLSHFFIYK